MYNMYKPYMDHMYRIRKYCLQMMKIHKYCTPQYLEVFFIPLSAASIRTALLMGKERTLLCNVKHFGFEYSVITSE